MSLTQDDLQAIQQIVEKSADEVRADVAAGFVEVHEKIGRVESRLDGVESRLDSVESRLDKVETTVNRIETKLDGTIETIDEHTAQIAKLKKQTA